jgi:hypothetical protein
MIMVANYATVTYVTVIGGAPVTVEAGETRDSVTDAALIATWAANWTATAPTPASHGAKRAGWLSSYPRGEVH